MSSVGPGCRRCQCPSGYGYVIIHTYIHTLVEPAVHSSRLKLFQSQLVRAASTAQEQPWPWCLSFVAVPGLCCSLCVTHGLFTLVLLYSAELGAVQSQRIHVEIVLLTVRFRDVMDSVRSRFFMIHTWYPKRPGWKRMLNFDVWNCCDDHIHSANGISWLLLWHRSRDQPLYVQGRILFSSGP